MQILSSYPSRERILICVKDFKPLDIITVNSGGI